MLTEQTNMADSSELRMNVVALKGVDPYGKDILASATHVALYTFNSEINEWEKTDVEGALFVYSRSGEPYHGILIMNRLSRNNLVEPVTKGLDLQVQEPFLLYRNAKHNIFGIWFYEKDDCRRIANMLTNLIKESDKTNKGQKLNNSDTTTASSEANILTMLTKAQEDFNYSKSPPKKNFEKPNPPDVTSQSVKEFFAKASGGASYSGPKPTTLFMNPPKEPASTNQLQPLLQRLMSNPANTVEHIEKQQRSVTPSETNTKPSTKSKIQNKANGKTSRDFKIRPLTNDMENLKCDSPETNFIESPAPKQPLMFNSSFGCPSPSNLAEQITLSTSLCAETPPKPALMPPTMFTSSASKDSSFHNSSDLTQTPLLRNPSSVLLDESVPSVEPLTKNQLLQAFNYLIKNDPEFVTKLHEAYVKSFSELVL